VLLINNDQVKELLTPRMTREALRTAYDDLATGDAVCRPRIDIRIPTQRQDHVYQWGSMEGGSVRGYFAIRMKSDVLVEQQYSGVRTQEKFAQQPGLYCGFILLTSIESAVPLAFINDGHLQHMRVAADSAIGTDIMARQDVSAMGMLGSGEMARAHVEALLEVRNIRHLKVYSPTSANRERFATEMRAKFGIEVVVCSEPESVYRGVDLLAACTDSVVPVVRGEWLEAGTHVISIGGRPDAAADARFDVVLHLGVSPSPVGRPDLGTADEYLGYNAQPDHPVWKSVKGGKPARAKGGRGTEVLYADVLAGRSAGRSRADQVTYSERGNIQGAQFYAVAGAVYEAAIKSGKGREIPTEWFLQDIRD
jgi:alanine dehydrogenase